MEDGGERDWVWTGADGGVDGRWRGARLGVDGCGWWCGWKMEGSEAGCGRVWTVVRMEDGGERDWVWSSVDGVGGGCGRWRRARLGVDGCRRVWTVVWMEGSENWVRRGVDGVVRLGGGLRMEDGGERDWVWSSVDGGVAG